jgi:hypothetical protein
MTCHDQPCHDQPTEKKKETKIFHLERSNMSLVISQPIPFAHGKGRKLNVSIDGKAVTFQMAGTLVYGLSEPFDAAENSNRRSMLVRLDRPQDRAHNAGLIELLQQYRSEIFEHVITHSSTIFEKSKPSRSMLEDNGFDIVTMVGGAQCIKVRVDLEGTDVTVEDNAVAAQDKTAIMKVLKVPSQFIPAVLKRDSHVMATVGLDFVWLDNLAFGVTLGVKSLMAMPAVAPPAPHIGQVLQALNDNLLEISTEPKKFPGGAGKYVPMKLLNGYPTWVCNEPLEVKFAPSAGKDAPADSDRLSMPVLMRTGSALAELVAGMNTRVIEAACNNPGWFGKQKIGDDTAQCMFRAPDKKSEGYEPMLYMKLQTRATGGRQATKFWICPTEATWAEVETVMDHASENGFVETTAADVKRGSRIYVIGTASCVWLQSATFGWGFNATDVYILPATDIRGPNGEVVQVTGQATMADIDSCFGKRQCVELVEIEQSY